MQFSAIATGLYLEALAVDGDTAWFSDVIIGGVQRLPRDAETACWLPQRKWIGGVLVHESGSVLCSGPGGIAWFDPASGRSGNLLTEVDGTPLPGVNEMCSDGNGGIYFGTLDAAAIESGKRPRPAALYHFDVNGRVTLLCDGLAFTNGLSLSLDRATLFLNESFVGTFAYPILADGRLGERRLLLQKPDCDGMALDVQGRLWITGFNSTEVLCVNADGSIEQRVPVVASGAVTNVRFGGADGRDFYVTAVPPDAGAKLVRGERPSEPDSVLYRARAEVAGRMLPPPRFQLGRVGEERS